MKLIIPPPVQGVIAGAAMWAVDTYLEVFDIDFLGRTQIALVIIAVGFAIELIAIAAFVRAKTTVNPMAPQNATRLVVTGLYKVSRNPMYLGLAILLSGWGLYLGEALNVLTLVAFVVLITRLQILPEEAVLRKKFGEPYDAYCRKVRRWI